MYTPRDLWYDVVRFMTWSALRVVFNIRIRVTGRENVPRTGGFILAGNHVSNLDPPVLSLACPRQVNFMAKEELFRNPVFGSLIRSVRAFPVKRGANDLGAVRTAFYRVKKGGGLLLFPQGGRRPVDDNNEPEPGVGMLSLRMGVPVVPAFVEGTEKALPAGSSGIKRNITITVRFGAPLVLGQGKDYQGASARIMAAIRSLRSG